MEQWWTGYTGFDPEAVQRVIEATCQVGKFTKKEFWEAVKDQAQQQRQQVIRDREKRRLDLEQERRAASLPNDVILGRVQRYEAHLSRQFYRALHELQRLQAARLGLRPAVPLALDIDINSDGVAVDATASN